MKMADCLDLYCLGGGGPAPERTAPATGAKLVAQGSSRQEHRLASRTGTFAEAKKLKELNVKNIRSGGPGSGRHPMGEAHSVAKQYGYGSPKGRDVGIGRYAQNIRTYTHSEGHELTVSKGALGRENFWRVRKDQKTLGEGPLQNSAHVGDLSQALKKIHS